MKFSPVAKGGAAGLVALLVCVMGASVFEGLEMLRNYDGLIVLIVTVVVGYMTSEKVKPMN